MRFVNRDIAEHYKWKEVCDGWHLSARGDLSIIAEKSRILSGRAVMRFPGGERRLEPGDGMEIEPLEAHRMANDSDAQIARRQSGGEMNPR